MAAPYVYALRARRSSRPDRWAPIRSMCRVNTARSTIADFLDLVLLDIGDTLVKEHPPGTPTSELVPTLLPLVAHDLKQLSRVVHLGAVTNTSVMHEADVRRLLSLVAIDDLLEVVVTSCDVGAAKPDPSALIEANRRFGDFATSRVLYVGDQKTDQEAALAADMHFVFITEAGVLAAVRNWTRSAADF